MSYWPPIYATTLERANCRLTGRTRKFSAHRTMSRLTVRHFLSNEMHDFQRTRLDSCEWPMSYFDSKRKRETLTLVVVFVLVLGVSALVVYLLSQRPTGNEPSPQTSTATSTVT